MASAGHAAAVKVSTTSGGTYTVIDGLDQGSEQIVNDILDVSNLAGGKERDKIYGRQDIRGRVSGHSEASDTNGWVLMRDGAANQTNVFLQFLRDGTNGRRSEFLVSNFEESYDGNGAVDWSCDIERTGASVAVP